MIFLLAGVFFPSTLRMNHCCSCFAVNPLSEGTGQKNSVHLPVSAQWGWGGTRCRKPCPRSASMFLAELRTNLRSSPAVTAAHKCHPLAAGIGDVFEMSSLCGWGLSCIHTVNVKAFHCSYTETEQFLNQFIKMSAVPISRQIKQQWISIKVSLSRTFKNERKRRLVPLASGCC